MTAPSTGRRAGSGTEDAAAPGRARAGAGRGRDAYARVAELLSPHAPRAAPEGETEAAVRGDRGYLDLLGGERPASTGPVQDLMLSRPVALVYERWWRPALGRAAKGMLGPGMAEERRIGQAMLDLAAGDRVLDVACGTGAFTRHFAAGVGEEGLSVGIDVSETMLARAVEEAPPASFPQIGFVRGDAQELPFRDHSFDAVCCFAALHLFADPMRALDRMTAVLRPGGRIAIFTSSRLRSAPFRTAEWLIGRRTGMRMFERSDVTGALGDRGFVQLEQRLAGFTQFVGGRLPAAG